MLDRTPVSKDLLWIYELSFGCKCFVLLGIFVCLAVIILTFLGFEYNPRDAQPNISSNNTVEIAEDAEELEPLNQAQSANEPTSLIVASCATDENTELESMRKTKVPLYKLPDDGVGATNNDAEFASRDSFSTRLEDNKDVAQVNDTEGNFQSANNNTVERRRMMIVRNVSSFTRKFLSQLVIWKNLSGLKRFDVLMGIFSFFALIIFFLVMILTEEGKKRAKLVCENCYCGNTYEAAKSSKITCFSEGYKECVERSFQPIEDNQLQVPVELFCYDLA